MKQFSDSDTIVAISSSLGPALRSIIRLSGPEAWAKGVSITEGLSDHIIAPREPVVVLTQTLQLNGLTLPIQKQFWPAGRSYTGQPLVELHLSAPGGIAQILLSALVDRGARLAQPGEFSLRAFLAGRIDLTRAEAVAGIFQANSQAQLQVAFDQLAGGLVNRLERLRARLLDLLAWLEATLDFVEESDVSPIARNFTAEELRGAALELTTMARQWSDRAETSKTIRVLLAGPPNSGKSSLFNTLSHSAKSLVSPQAGTTRDYLEATIELAPGLKVTLVDTAGLGESVGLIDRQSQQIARREQLLADLIIDCQAIDEPINAQEFLKYPDEVPVIRITTKIDVSPEFQMNIGNSLKISCFTGVGMSELKQAILQKLQADRPAGILLESTLARARDSLVSASEALVQASDTITNQGGDELVAMDLRLALESLDFITGRDVTEEMLDRIFSR
ncbi:MAG: tRNA modification GTPase, partial [bacterium]